MRRFKFNTQIIILYVSLLLIATILFSLIVLNRSKDVSSAQTYNRLQDYLIVTKNQWEKGEELSSSSQLNVASIQGKFDYKPNGDSKLILTYDSDSIYDYLTYEQITHILNHLETKIKPGINENNFLELSNNDYIYYTYAITKETTPDNYYNFVLVVTDSRIENDIRTQMSYQVICIFGIVLTFAFLILGLWGGAYVSRINRIKLHIANLPKSSYTEEYFDDGKDELSELSVSIEKMREELLENERTKQEMLQNISHDFKTPIAVIKSYAEAIQDGMADADDASIIIKQATSLQHKVTRLLQYNRLEYLQKTEEFNDIAMKEIVRDVVNSYRYQTPNIEFDLDLDDTKFKGYQENFYTIVDNLVDNAKRYAKHVIKITLKNGVLVVYNDGKPISDQFLNALFKPYEKGADGQFGLGMSIVKKTLDFFEYDLSVKNEEQGGVSFTIKKRENKPIYTQ